MDQTLAVLSPGQSLRVKTNLGETIEGLLLAYDRTAQCILLQQSTGSYQNPTGPATPGSTRTVSFLKQSGIQDISVVRDAKGSDDATMRRDLEPPRFDFQVLEARERAAVRKEEEELQLRKAGATSDAMDLHAALARTLPVAWDKATIIVMGEVRINSPYVAESVTGGSAAARERVKMVLSKERERLGLRS